MNNEETIAIDEQDRTLAALAHLSGLAGYIIPFGGLIVPVIRRVETMSLDDIGAAVADLKEATRNRTVAPQDMIDYTFTVSNFGMLAGRYATPLMVPPTVAILGTGRRACRNWIR